MIDDTNKPATAEAAAPATNPAAKVSAVSREPKPAAKPRPAKPAAAAAKPVRITVAKMETPPAKKSAAQAAVRKPAPAKIAVDEPAPSAVKNSKAGKPAKAKKSKLVRDSFTMPELEYAQIKALKKRCLDAGISAKKSEILRAAVANLAKLSDTSLLAAVRRLEVIKTGRPAKGSKK